MSKKYHYESGAIHNDNHKELNIGSVSESTLNNLINQFFKDDALDAEVVEEQPLPDLPHDGEEAGKELNYFAPTKSLQEFLKKDWFREFRTDNKYDEQWTDGFISALMGTEWKDNIAKDWAIDGERQKKTVLKGYIVGVLRNTGVLKGSFVEIAKKIGLMKEPRSFAKYIGDGKKQPYAEWVKEYVEAANKA